MTRWLIAATVGVLFTSACSASPPDWLLDPASFKAEVKHDKAKHELVLSNGLARRIIRLAPNAATVALDQLITGESLLRAWGLKHA